MKLLMRVRVHVGTEGKKALHSQMMMSGQVFKVVR